MKTANLGLNFLSIQTLLARILLHITSASVVALHLAPPPFDSVTLPNLHLYNQHGLRDAENAFSDADVEKNCFN